ncbi:MAG TPA: hypothetical protein VIN07_14875 [Flavipsychrobacter sp.]
MMNIKLTGLIVLIAVCFSSCSQKIVGTWNISNYESVASGGQAIKVKNIGDITFNKNNTGQTNIMYSIFENKVEDKSAFEWSKAEDGESITISGEGTQLNKTWLIVEDERKYQRWKSTDGANTLQVLELVKE